MEEYARLKIRFLSILGSVFQEDSPARLYSKGCCSSDQLERFKKGSVLPSALRLGQIREHSNFLKREGEISKELEELRNKLDDLPKSQYAALLGREGSDQKHKKAAEGIAVYIDWVTVNDQIGLPDPQKLGRAKYFGFHGARNWLDVTVTDWYRQNARPVEVAKQCVSLIKEDQFEPVYFVSLGPGDAVSDWLIYDGLTTRSQSLSYVPVDISPGLLISAAGKMITHGANVPFAMLADFESRLHFVFNRFEDKGPKLVSLIGNTFGNLDTDEIHVINALHRHMQGDDRLLLHVNAYERHDPDDDNLARADLPVEARTFLARPILDCYRKEYEERGIAFEALVESFSSEVVCSLIHANPQADLESVSVSFTPRGKNHPVLLVRRYSRESLIRWLEKCGFKPVDSRHSRIWEADSSGIGHLVLLCRKV